MAAIDVKQIVNMLYHAGVETVLTVCEDYCISLVYFDTQFIFYMTSAFSDIRQ